MDEILKRSEKLSFYEVDGVFYRMRGFTEFSVRKNPKEYSRKYVDEKTTRKDVVGYEPSVSFAFDRFSDNEVHTDMVAISDKELISSDAVRNILIVDLSKEENGSCPAIMRSYSVIPDTEGNDSDSYTYAGTLSANGDAVFGSAATDDGWLTAVFTEAV